jgi:hypothetical protein
MTRCVVCGLRAGSKSKVCKIHRDRGLRKPDYDITREELINQLEFYIVELQQQELVEGAKVIKQFLNRIGNV